MTADDLVTGFGIASVNYFDIKFDDLQSRSLSFPFENRKILGRCSAWGDVVFGRSSKLGNREFNM